MNKLPTSHSLTRAHRFYDIYLLHLSRVKDLSIGNIFSTIHNLLYIRWRLYCLSGITTAFCYSYLLCNLSHSNELALSHVPQLPLNTHRHKKIVIVNILLWNYNLSSQVWWQNIINFNLFSSSLFLTNFWRVRTIYFIMISSQKKKKREIPVESINNARLFSSSSLADVHYDEGFPLA